MKRRTDSFTISAMALALTSAITSLLGLVFWALAAHSFDAASVGQANALISASMLLAGLAQLNLSAVNVRFLPAAGARTRELVIGSYALTSVLAAVVTLAFVLLDIGHSYLHRSLGSVLTFFLAVLIFLWSVLGDSVLIALRRSEIVLLENSALAVLKLLALFGVAGSFTSGWAISASWLLPSLLLTLLVAAYILRVTPWTTPTPGRRPRAGEAPPSSLPPVRTLASFVLAEHLKSMLTTGAALLLPLIVAEMLGLTATAIFTVPWLVITAVNAMIYSISMSLVVEAQYDPLHYAQLLRRAITIGVTLTIGAALVLGLGAPLILGLLGPQYAEGGTTLLRLLALSLPLGAVSLLYGVLVWIEARMWWLLALQSANVTIMLGATFLLIPGHGLAGVGWAFLLAQAVMGIGSIVPITRRLRELKSPPPAPVESAPVPATRREARRVAAPAAEPPAAAPATRRAARPAHTSLISR